MNPEMTMVMRRNEEREALKSIIQQWNANRLDLFELSEPNEVSFFLLLFFCFFKNVLTFLLSVCELEFSAGEFCTIWLLWKLK